MVCFHCSSLCLFSFYVFCFFRVCIFVLFFISHFAILPAPFLVYSIASFQSERPRDRFEILFWMFYLCGKCYVHIIRSHSRRRSFIHITSFPALFSHLLLVFPFEPCFMLHFRSRQSTKKHDKHNRKILRKVDVFRARWWKPAGEMRFFVYVGANACQ